MYEDTAYLKREIIHLNERGPYELLTILSCVWELSNQRRILGKIVKQNIQILQTNINLMYSYVHNKLERLRIAEGSALWVVIRLLYIDQPSDRLTTL